jgi:hypothetical protein
VTWSRTKHETLALPINALALLILHNYRAKNGWNWQNWMRESEHYGKARDPEINAALCEGWGWLMTHGLVVRDASQSSPDAYRISRLGQTTLQDGGARLVAAERLGVSLHRQIAQQVEEQFLLANTTWPCSPRCGKSRSACANSPSLQNRCSA